MVILILSTFTSVIRIIIMIIVITIIIVIIIIIIIISVHAGVVLLPDCTVASTRVHPNRIARRCGSS
jgi:hypothetical protein